MEEAINVTINDSTFVEVPLNYDQGCRSYALSTRGGGAFVIQKSESSAAYWTVNANEAISFRELISKKGDTLCWAKSASGAEVIEVVIIQNE